MPIAVMDRRLEQAILSGDLAKVKKCYNVKCKAAEHVIKCSNPDIFRFLIKKGFPMVNAALWYEYAYEHSDLKLFKVTFKHIEPRTLEFAPEYDIPIKIKEFPTLIITKENGHLVKYELQHNTMRLEDPLARAIVLDRTDIVDFLLDPGSRGGVLKKYSTDCADAYIKLAMYYANPKTILALSPDILHQAARYGRIDVFKYGKDKFRPDSQCMEIALNNEDLKLVKYLYKFIPFDSTHLALEKLHDFVMPKADYDTVTSYYIKKNNVEIVKSRKRYTFNHINIAIDANSIEIILHIIRCINNGNLTREHEKRAIEKHSNEVVLYFINSPLSEHVDVAIENGNVYILKKWFSTYEYTTNNWLAALQTGNCEVFKYIADCVSVEDEMFEDVFMKCVEKYDVDKNCKTLNVLCQQYPAPEKVILYAIRTRRENALEKLIRGTNLEQGHFQGSEAVVDELCRQIRSAHRWQRWDRMNDLLKLSKCSKVLALTKELLPANHGYDYFVNLIETQSKSTKPVYAKVNKLPSNTPKSEVVYATVNTFPKPNQETQSKSTKPEAVYAKVNKLPSNTRPTPRPRTNVPLQKSQSADNLLG